MSILHVAPIFMGMQQRIVVNNGKRYLVNVATDDEGVGAGFAVGQLVLKSNTDKRSGMVIASGRRNDFKSI